MNFSAVVFRNIRVSAGSVPYGQLVDALLSEGVLLDEIVQLAYDRPDLVMATLERLIKRCDGVFIICDEVLLPVAREALSAATRLNFADGFLLKGEKLYFALPSGRKGCELVQSQVIPAIDERRGGPHLSLVFKTVLAPVSKVMATIQRAEEESEGRFTFFTSEEYGVGRIEIVYPKETNKALLDEVTRIFATELRAYTYAMEDVTISQRLFDKLKLRRMKLSTAESFTSGRVGSAIVENSGASEIFFEGLNVYDSASKMLRLGVKESTLKSKGAVSKETAFEMAEGLLKHCDVAISTTGIAGPNSDGSGAPVGLCYIGIGTKEHIHTFEYRLSGDRETITKTAVNLALFLAYREIH